MTIITQGGGNAASKAAVAAFEQCLPEEGFSAPEVIIAGFEAANNDITAMQTPAIPMKSTAVLLAAEDGVARFAHCGDSRGYMFKGGNVAVQTTDHSVSQMAVFRGDITLDRIRFHPSRNQLMRSLGAECKAEITELPEIGAGDAFLLCSDGFWEYVTEREMESDLADSGTARDWVELMLLRLNARVGGDNDNFSVVAVVCV